jgi:hypothetical protein
MKIYAVEQKYFDKGKIEAKISSFESSIIPKNHSEEHTNYDYYVDYFDNLKDAENWKKQALKA